ncbi:30S ribosome-binding factor RbfA [Loigolactobacillus iwatensis]|uniref:30S ribosome-binding factor RbfA n=1 Tax=Loigolactobacillus iwatensis TaxID=1267156 RepID=UPI000F7EB2BB|nr:30S ribosome-binding factor RbfA [Loigolactobacillus iwatensis]
MAHYRIGRVSQEIQKETTDILMKRVRDPRVQGVTITGVDVTGDLQQATIYYSILSDTAHDGEKAQQGLEKASGLIRKELGQRIRLYKIPELTFERDESVQYGNRIDQLIDQLHRQERG